MELEPPFCLEPTQFGQSRSWLWDLAFRSRPKKWRLRNNDTEYPYSKGPEHFRHHVLCQTLLLVLGVEFVDLARPNPPSSTFPLLGVSLGSTRTHF